MNLRYFSFKNIWTASLVLFMFFFSGLQAVQAQCDLDTEAPVITFTAALLQGVNNGDTLTTECGTPLSLNANSVSATDNVTVMPIVTFQEVILVEGECEPDGLLYLMRCTWTATDECGNASSAFIFMRVVDTQPPVFFGLPADVVVQPGEPIPTTPDVTAIDSCFGELPVTVEVAATLFGCVTNSIYTFTATDNCGAATTAQWKVTSSSAPNAPATVSTNGNDFCLDGGPAILNVTSTGTIPAGFTLWHVLVKDGVVVATSADGNFTLTQGGDFTAHALLLEDGNDLSFIEAGVTSVETVQNTLFGGVGGCGALNVSDFASVSVDPSCISICIPLTVSIVSSTQAQCGNNASVTFGVTGGAPSDFIYSIEPNSGSLGGLTYSELPAGTYTITATRIDDPSCFDTETVTLVDEGVVPVIDEIIVVSPTICGSSDGSISVTPTIPGDYLYSFDGGVTVTANNTLVNLPIGVYSIILYSGACSSEPSVIDMPPSGDCPPCSILTETDITINIDDCNGVGELCLPVSPSEAALLDITVNGDFYSGGFTPCGFDTIIAYTLFTVSGQGNSGPYQVQEWDVNGVILSGTFNTQAELVDWMNAQDPTGNWAMNADGLPIVEGGDLNITYGTMRIRRLANNIVATIQPNLGITPSGTFITFSAGLNEIQIYDAANLCLSVAIVNVVCPQPPIANDDNVETDQDVSVIIDILANDLTNGSLTTINILNNPTHGTAQFQPGFTVLYTPEQGFCGEDQFTYEICNGAGCDQATVTITVVCPDPPFAADDASTTDVNTEVITDVLANDNINGTLASIDIVTQPANGLVVILPDNTISYTPNSDFCGQDSYTYSICNDFACDTATVAITINCPPVDIIANDDAAATQQGEPVNINVLGNDIVPGTLVSIEIVTNPTNGTAVFAPDNSIDYTPNDGFCGQDEFTYAICNATGCDTATVTITIACPLLPLAIDDTYTTDTNTSVVNTILTNDQINGSLQDIYIVTLPANGSAELLDDNTVLYTPVLDFCGSDSYTYAICNEFGCDTATVTINVTCPVVETLLAVDDNVTTDTNTLVNITILGNDIIPGTLQTVVILDGPTNGTATLLADNTVDYTPNQDFCGDDSFTYEICNLDGCDTATVTINITCPVVETLLAVDDNVTTDTNTLVNITILDNDIIPGTLQTVVILDGPTNGTATLLADNTVDYTPNQDFCGDDSFTYEICNLDGCDTATVTINVTCPVVETLLAVDDNVTTDTNTLVNITILGNDIIPGTLQTVVILDGPTNGTATLLADNTVDYTPNQDFCGDDSFTYEICNLDGCDTATVTINVTCPVVETLLAVDDNVTTDTNTLVNITILGNDIIPGTLQTVVILNGPTNGTATLLADNTVDYTPNQDFCGIDSFTYEICNLDGCDTATVTINITCPVVCELPIAANDNVTTDTNTLVVVQVLPNDVVSCTLALLDTIQGPANGTLTVNPDSTFTYTPNLDFCGADSFAYQVCNEIGCDTAWVFVDVTCPEECLLPIALNDLTTTDTNTLVNIEVLVNDTISCTVSSLDTISSPTNGSLTILPDNTFDYTPNAGFCGADSFQYAVCNEIGCDTAWVFVDVTCPTGLPPIANPDYKEAPKPNVTVTIPILDNDIFNDTEDNIDVTILLQPSNGLITLDNNGDLVYVPDADFCGYDTLIYQLCNSFGCDTALVVVRVRCGALVIFNGLTPNGDGANDTWIIQGIDEFPNNRVTVFNRWGNRIYQQSAYKNDWEGTWEDSKLPSGTYYYCVEDGEGNTFYGWLQLFR